MRFLPVFLDMHERKVLVVGGGRVALRKIRQLCSAKADVSVIAPEISAEIKALEQVKYMERGFAAADIISALSLVFVATDNKQVNDRVSELCRAVGVLCSRCDDFNKGDFITGNTVSRGEITVSIVSGGVPALSKKMAEDIDASISPELEALSSLLSELRPQILSSARVGPKKSVFIARWLEDDKLEKVRKEGIDSIREEIIACL